jgi:hypothetical protein
MSDQIRYFQQLQHDHENVKQQQHVQFFRKVLLRKHLLRWAVPGPAYVPFIGDGDIAAKLYSDRLIYGADIADYRVEKCLTRGLEGHIKVANCDVWPFKGCEETFVVADFDAYVEPYRSFRAFWKEANKGDRMVLFFTDGRREGMTRTNHWVKPDGSKVTVTRAEKLVIFNAYMTKHIWPWFEEHIEPYRILDKWRYQRARMMYWGVAIQK